MLDQVPGVVAVGELTEIWDAALRRGERCGCGEPFADCPFWSEVGERAFGGWDRIDAERMLATRDSLARNRHLPLLLAGPLLPSFRARVDEYASSLARIFDAVAAVSGCKVIVDASKWPTHAMVLRRIPGLDLRMAHLVRDPRGVSYSWARAVDRPHAMGSRSDLDRSEMRRDHPAVSAFHWTAVNLGIEIITALGVPRHFIRYEDLVAAPRATLVGVLDHASHPAADEALDFVGDGVLRLAPGHGVAGNPSRFRHGDIALRHEDEWMTEMTRGSRLVVDAITYPLAAAYRRSRPSGE